MTTTFLRARARRLLALAAAAPLALVTGLSAPTSATAASPGPVQLTVMTRNLYLGADLMPVVGALATTSDPATIAAAAGQVWSAVQATDPPGRMSAVADEIAAAEPDLVGLQEVTTWQYCTGVVVSTCTITVYDFEQELLDALAALGEHYAAVPGATSTNFESPPIPLPPLGQSPLVRLVDHDVILYRTDLPDGGLTLANAATGHFTHLLSFPLASGGTLPVLRGWGSVDVTLQGEHFRFVNTHLEAFGLPGLDAEQLRTAQVAELLAGPLATAQREVLVGDLNSQANRPDQGSAYLLASRALRDAWRIANPTDPGLSCCQTADLTNAVSALDQRIDLVLYRGGLVATDASLVGDVPSVISGGVRWPSDHAGVVAGLRLG